MTAQDLGVALGFWGLAALAVLASLGILVSRNLLHAVMFLILSFIALAGLFVTLSADFIAVAQVLVYAGAVGVLIIFAIMLTPTRERVNSDTVYFGPGFVIGGLIMGMMAFVAFRTPWRTAVGGGFETTVEAIGVALTSRWALPFEIASVLLIAAMIGAIVLVRSAPEPPSVPEGEPLVELTDSEPERALVPSGENH